MGGYWVGYLRPNQFRPPPTPPPRGRCALSISDPVSFICWFLGYLHGLIDLRLWPPCRLDFLSKPPCLVRLLLDEVNQLSILTKYFEENGIKSGKFLSSARLDIGNYKHTKLTRHLLTQLLIKMWKYKILNSESNTTASECITLQCYLLNFYSFLDEGSSKSIRSSFGFVKNIFWRNPKVVSIF